MLLLLLAWGAQAQEEGAAVKLGTGAKVKNTIIWGNKGIQLNPEVTPETSHIFAPGVASPLFLDSLNGDFRLRKGSPLIDSADVDTDAGMGLYFDENALDLWGNPRLSGTKFDIGAHEYRLYKIRFIKAPEVVIEQVAVDGHASDSNGVHLGETYKFRPVYDGITGIETDLVIVRDLTSNELIPDEDGYYYIRDVQTDKEVEIIVTPPIFVRAMKSANGIIAVTREDNTTVSTLVKDTVMVVEENEEVRLDTTADEGYYCYDVYVAADATGPWSSIKSKVGAGKSYAVTGDVWFRAEFRPRSISIELEVNDRSRGTITVTDNDSPPNTYTLDAGNTGSGSFTYAPDRSFSVTVAPETGYELSSLTVYDADGSSNAEVITAAKTTNMRLNGLVIKAVFVPLTYTVTWDPLYATLVVTPGTMEVNPSGGFMIEEVEYNTTLTVTATPEEGYNVTGLTANGLTTGVSATGTPYQWSYVVKGNTELDVTTDLQKQTVTITSNTPLVLANTWSTAPVLTGAGGDEIAYGSTLEITVSPATGYECIRAVVNGAAPQAVTGNKLTLPAITSAQTVELQFTRIPYEVTYINATPTMGSLTVSKQEPDASAWTAFVSSPGSAAYGDKIKAEVSPNTGYKLKSLTLTPDGEGPVDYTSAGTFAVDLEKDLAIAAEFEPILYTVTLRKVYDPAYAGPEVTGTAPTEGKVELKVGGTTRLTVDYSDADHTGTVQLPYGTVVQVVPTTNVDYVTDKIEADGTDITTLRQFTVTGDAEADVWIVYHKTDFAVTWETVYTGFTSTIDVQKSGGGTVLNGSSYPTGTALEVIVDQQAGEFCTGVFANGVDITGTDPVANPPTASISGEAIHFTAEFVKMCRVKITPPTGGTITVKDDKGTVYNDGDPVPAGTTLKATLVTTLPGYYCTGLTAEGNSLYAWSGTSTTSPPTTTGEQTYTIPVNHAGGDILFTGTAAEYYCVRFTTPINGTLAVEADGTALSAGTQYWYPKNAAIGITAENTTTGYTLNASRVVNNAADASTIVLDEISADHYGLAAPLGLVKELDLSATFVKKEYAVTLNLTGLGAASRTDALAAIGFTGTGAPDLDVLWEDATDISVTVQVAHGDKLTLRAEPKPGFAAKLQFNSVDELSLTMNVINRTTPAITGPMVIDLIFEQTYQVDYDPTDILKVTKGGNAVVRNAYVFAGDVLRGYTVTPAVSDKYNKLVVYNSSGMSEYVSGMATQSDGTIELDFTMPAYNVYLDAEKGLKTFDLSTDLTDPSLAATLTVNNLKGGPPVEVVAGSDVLAYGDELRVDITLPANDDPALGALTESLYEVKAVRVTMGGTNLSGSLSGSGLAYSYAVPLPVSGDVAVTVTLARKRQHLILRVVPSGRDFGIEWSCDTLPGGAWTTPVVYKGPAAQTSISLPVGTKVKARAVGSEEGYELEFFPTSGQQITTEIDRQLQLGGSLNLSVRFRQQTFPLQVTVKPAGGGVLKWSGSELVTQRVVYGTSLSSIVPEPLNTYFRLDSVTAYMGGVNLFKNQVSPYEISKVTDSVGIEMRMTRLYKIQKDVVGAGDIEIREFGQSVSAVDGLFPANTIFQITVSPQDDSYECVSLQAMHSMGGNAFIPSAGGLYSINPSLTQYDIVIRAEFALKTHEVFVQREPVGGGNAVLYQGDKSSGGILLLELANDDPQTATMPVLVEHGTTLHFYAEPNGADYEVASLVTGANTLYTQGQLVVVTSDTVFSVSFGRLYRLQILDDSVQVYTSGGIKLPADTMLAEGTPLYFAASRFGKAYTEVTLRETGADPADPALEAWTTATDGVIEDHFEMPGVDAEVNGASDWKRYTVRYSVAPDPHDVPSGDGQSAITVRSFTGVSPGVPVANGGSVQHGDSLEVVLTPHAWYDVVSMTATVDRVPAGVKSGADTLRIAEALGDVEIAGVVLRKQQKLYIYLEEEALADGDTVRVITEDGIRHDYLVSDSLPVDVGSKVVVQALSGSACVMDSLITDLGGRVVAKPFETTFDMPVDKTASVTAYFSLKEYPVLFATTEGGTIMVTPTFDGAVGSPIDSGDLVKHYTELAISLTATSASYIYRPGNFITRVGANVAANPAVVPSVTDTVRIEATFERVYEVRVVQPDVKQGTLTIAYAGNSAVGKRYLAGTELDVALVPQTGYEVTGLFMNGVSQAILPAGGVIVCEVPDNPAVDSVEFTVTLAVKQYDIKYFVSGNGSLAVEGMAGGRVLYSDVSGVSRAVSHFDTLYLEVSPGSPAYRAVRYIVNLPDGTPLPVTATDTAIVVTGNLTVEVEFEKQYVVMFEQPQQLPRPEGTLTVTQDGRNITSGEYVWVPQLQSTGSLSIDLVEGEGYDVEFLTVNGVAVSQPFGFGFAKEELFDTIVIDAQLKVRELTVAVVQPAYGKIDLVERSVDDGATWQPLPVLTPVTVDYWDQIRAFVTVDDPAQFRTDHLSVVSASGTGSLQEGVAWTMKEDVVLEAVIIPNTYTVYYEQPDNGALWVETLNGDTVRDGEAVYYLTKLIVRVQLDDEVGYELAELTVDNVGVDDQDTVTVEADMYVFARIALRTWEVTTSATGQGVIHVYDEHGYEISSRADPGLVNHYERLQISFRPAAGWMLYAHDLTGTAMQLDSTFVVEGHVAIFADFRQMEEYQFPAVFTPNGDGQNDTWQVKGLWQDPENTLEIYNRMQQRVYKVSPYLNEWNGTTDDGTILPAGHYIYKLTTGKKVHTGIVSIVRN